MKKPDPKPRKNPAGKASKPKASTGEGTKRKAPTRKRAPTKSAESLPEWSEERLFSRILFDFSSDLRRAFNTIDVVLRLLSRRQRIQYTDEQHLNLKSMLMAVGQAGWEERFSTDPHHWGFLALSHCIKVGYPIPAELKARYFEQYGEKLAEIMRLFVREVDPAKLTSDVAELYADNGGAFYKKSKKLGARKQGNPPTPMVQFFTCAVIVPRLADEIESHGAQEELMDCEEDWEDLEFETLWRDVLEPYARERWDDFVRDSRDSFYSKEDHKRWGWTPGRWREAVKKALHKYLVSIHFKGVDLSKVCFERMKAPGNKTPAQD